MALLLYLVVIRIKGIKSYERSACHGVHQINITHFTQRTAKYSSQDEVEDPINETQATKYLSKENKVTSLV